MYSKFGYSRWILVGQILENGQWPAVISRIDYICMPMSQDKRILSHKTIAQYINNIL